MITKIHETCFKACAIQDKMKIIKQQLATDYDESATTDYDEGVKIIWTEIQNTYTAAYTIWKAVTYLQCPEHR